MTECNNCIHAYFTHNRKTGKCNAKKCKCIGLYIKNNDKLLIEERIRDQNIIFKPTKEIMSEQK